jgi:rhamnosyltransferase
VIVRARDEAASIGRCLELLGGQSRPPAEVIVVDNESSDATAAIARAAGARVLTIGREQFSFGRALNLGAAAATGELFVALSAHAFPRDSGWLSRLAAALVSRGDIACACGERYRPDGSALPGPVRVGAADAERWPQWGYSNAAGGFRAELWRRRPFREDLPACEDKEWAQYWLREADLACLLDPALLVDHDHTHDPLREIFRRARREAGAYPMFLEDPPSSSVAATLREWWSDTRFYTHPWRARLSHRRAARLAGAFVGARTSLPPGRVRATGRA